MPMTVIVSRPRTRQLGLSLVELMVGLAVGMIVVAGAALLAASQISDNRRMVAEMQVMQDLRASLDIVSRELRRAGSQLGPESVVWTGPDHVGVDPGANDNIAVTTSGSTRTISFRYGRAGTAGGTLGFRSSGGKIATRIPAMAGAFQDLTDSRTMTINSMTVSSRLAQEPTPASPSAQQGIPCPQLCTTGPVSTASTACWPRVRVREYTIAIAGTSTLDTAITRSLSTTIRVRADELILSNGTSSGGTPWNICPVIN